MAYFPRIQTAVENSLLCGNLLREQRNLANWLAEPGKICHGKLWCLVKPISCHLQDCKTVLGLTLTRVRKHVNGSKIPHDFPGHKSEFMTFQSWKM